MFQILKDAYIVFLGHQGHFICIFQALQFSAQNVPGYIPVVLGTMFQGRYAVVNIIANMTWQKHHTQSPHTGDGSARSR